ncbi:hypothetical protein CC1G_03327 [Coprinopsis cinerea okayama7|uniref:rRNA adenine N(6)-methyltransferase n=1 Tax=Coprinopsis cinerea (strain Okayama-7 / 130 / ATCC MYA-4618 / FGSC 9003) TaxID=240176 RepID=A8N7I4_COPC7|nr:hypothetical protein CC1G_03327 [Coprinopsis cinerea okayama7\|eukprot:XP_001830790.1 hypothetical protein CC1G_03327 [Coprinopsis cinerea okayama7\
MLSASVHRLCWAARRQCQRAPPRPADRILVLSAASQSRWASTKSETATATPKRRRKKTDTLPQPSVNLPAPEKWAESFNVKLSTKPLSGRISVSNPETADKLANAFVPEGSKDKVIVEAYPGPGQLTRSLLKLPRERIKKIVLMEPIPGFLEWLKPLEELDDRISVMAVDPWIWSSYDELQEAGHLADVPILDWNAGVHPTLHFIQHLPSIVLGEQLLNQYIRTIPDQHWLYKYGRIPLDMVISARMLQRLTATTQDTNQRGKLGVFREATSVVTTPVPPSELDPYDEHFYPVRKASTSNASKALEDRKAGNPHLALRIMALDEPLIKPKTLETWDYVTRKLFISKATPVSKSIQTLAPGANAILKYLTDPDLPAEQQLDVSKRPQELTVHEWALIVNAFDKWPFRPKHLGIDVDLITTGKIARK